MPCDQCADEAKCDTLGVCQQYRQELPKPCRPGSRCERYARGLAGCVAGHCNPPADADHGLAAKPVADQEQANLSDNASGVKGPEHG